MPRPFFSRRRVWFLGLAAVLLLLVGFATAGPPKPSINPPGTFAFAALGDAPYYVWEDIKYPLVLRDLDQHALSFVVHVGDIFWRPCSDARYERSMRWFNGLGHPVIYTPGDNEWTDCWTRDEGGFAPHERLARLRQILFPNPGTSLGDRALALETQSSRGPFTEFVEHARWSHAGLTFATVHIVGSGNATEPFPESPPDQIAEAQRRTTAAIAWLHETFSEARASGASAVVIAFHADPGFELPVGRADRKPFEPILAALEDEVAAFGKPVLVIHGDSHEYTVDHPLVARATGQRLENLTRLEVPGSPDVGWVRVVVMPGANASFAFEERVVPRWKFW